MAHLLLVGATRGLGLHFAGQAARRGFTVSAIARRLIEEPVEFAVYKCDVMSRDSLSEAVSCIAKDHGAIEGIVCFQRYRSTEDPWEGELATSLGGSRNIIEVSNPFLRDGASIALVSSVNSRSISPNLPCGYHVAKAGIVQMARYYACVLGPRGIRVNVVSPGTFVKRENSEFFRSNQNIAEAIARRTAIKRIATVDDVSGAIFFFLDPSSSFVTGQELVVDGGASLYLNEALLDQ